LQHHLLTGYSMHINCGLENSITQSKSEPILIIFGAQHHEEI